MHYAVQVEARYSDTPVLAGNAGELRQVFANLIGNAVDAMQTGGRLQIRLRPATDARSGRRGVRITIADSGRGMNAETKGRLMEPFYTTKDTTGTGLGLWVSAEIVAKHRGHLSTAAAKARSGRDLCLHCSCLLLKSERRNLSRMLHCGLRSLR